MIARIPAPGGRNRMKLTPPILAVVFHLSALYVSASTITSSVTCSAGAAGVPTVTVTDPSTCSVQATSVGYNPPGTSHSAAQVWVDGPFAVSLWLEATGDLEAARSL